MTFPQGDDGRAARRLLIALVVIVGILVALDRIGVVVAERYTADTIQAAQNLPKRPDVNITGFPFLSQLATGDFDKVIVTDADVPIRHTAAHLRLSTIQVTLTRVHVSRDLSSLHARTAKAAATMSFRDLSRALGGVRIRYAGHGRVVASKTIVIAGHRFSGSVSVRPRIVNDTLSFGSAQIHNVGELVASTISALLRVFAVHLPLRKMPFDVHVRSLYADPSGLHLVLFGRDLSYSR